MKKYLFYVMRNDKMCFVHVLLNALDLANNGDEVKIVFEGQSVLLPPILAQENNPFYLEALKRGLIAGVCKACSISLGSAKAIEALGLKFLDDMKGHAGLKPFVLDGYIVFNF